MENLVKQIRVRFSGLGQGNEEDSNRITVRRTPPQKPEPSKTERKSQNWFQRQMSRDGDSSDGDFKTAVAAAAYAVSSLEEFGQVNQKRRSSTNGTGASLTKSKTRKDDQPDTAEPAKILSRRFTDKGEASFKKSEQTDKKPERALSAKKTVSFSDKKSNDIGAAKSENLKNVMQKQDDSSSQKSMVPAADSREKVDGKTETKADAWERAEMAKIEKKYEKMNSTIVSWESDKKKKARHRLDKKESELERRRARASRAYYIEIERIEKVAQEARALTKEKKRNDETVTRKKARKYRSTGQLPIKYFCF